MSKKRKRDWPPMSGRGGDVGPVIECYPDDIKAGAPLLPMYEFDPVTGLMKRMDPQPPHPFPEAAAAYAAAQAAKAAPPPPAEPPA